MVPHCAAAAAECVAVGQLAPCAGCWPHGAASISVLTGHATLVFQLELLDILQVSCELHAHQLAAHGLVLKACCRPLHSPPCPYIDEYISAASNRRLAAGQTCICHAVRLEGTNCSRRSMPSQRRATCVKGETPGIKVAMRMLKMLDAR